MSNLLRGEVRLRAGDREIVLRFTANEIAVVEEHLDLSVAQIGQMFAQPEKIRLATMRAMFWAAMLDKQPETTLQDAGRLMTDIGINEAMQATVKAFVAAFPEASEASNPPKAAKRGTGSRS